MAGTIFSHFQYFQMEDVWLLSTSLMTTSASSGGEEGRRQGFESYRQTAGKPGVVISAFHGSSSGEHLEASDGEVI